ncbi:hypothetical protein [Nocardioides sp.]|uniref:hypothetical protein n=1 Tax=Nocardioides sp. TaxID=35761 RepID=UPI003D14EB67
MNDVPWIEAATIGSEAARETWALAARHLLADVAADYHAVMTVQELGEGVQQRSRIRTRQAVHYWIGDVLFRVASDCERRREPNLGALCIRADGTMGDWYADTILTLRSESVNDADEHAAFERLECYRRHGAEIPPGGGEPARTVRVPGARTRPTSRVGAPARSPRAGKPTKPARVAKSDAPPPKVCDRCFMALPASGICDYCD